MDKYEITKIQKLRRKKSIYDFTGDLELYNNTKINCHENTKFYNIEACRKSNSLYFFEACIFNNNSYGNNSNRTQTNNKQKQQ